MSWTEAPFWAKTTAGKAQAASADRTSIAPEKKENVRFEAFTNSV